MTDLLKVLHCGCELHVTDHQYASDCYVYTQCKCEEHKKDCDECRKYNNDFINTVLPSIEKHTFVMIRKCTTNKRMQQWIKLCWLPAQCLMLKQENRYFRISMEAFQKYDVMKGGYKNDELIFS